MKTMKAERPKATSLATGMEVAADSIGGGAMIGVDSGAGEDSTIEGVVEAGEVVVVSIEVGEVGAAVSTGAGAEDSTAVGVGTGEVTGAAGATVEDVVTVTLGAGTGEDSIKEVSMIEKVLMEGTTTRQTRKLRLIKLGERINLVKGLHMKNVQIIFFDNLLYI